MKHNIFDHFFNRGKVTNQANQYPIESLKTESFMSLRTMKHYANDQFENGYSSIRAIADRFMVIRPYAQDGEGKPITPTPNVINALSRANTDMSPVDFRDAFAVMTLVHDKVYILVWQKNGIHAPVPAQPGIREENVAGYTFLEDVVEENVGNGLQYRVSIRNEMGLVEPRIYYPYQVAVMKDINPSNLAAGYSPSRAAKRWTRIDDYIADYQAGFFENGAIPAGQFIITAPTVKEYDDIVDGMEDKHKGARKNNNVIYTYQPIDTESGKPSQASITWVPFNTSNKDMALKDVFEQTNKKIDSVYGVSAFIRAIDEAPNYATAQVIERNFVENKIRPIAIKRWSRFQHEMNRITGGLGYAIGFHLATPNIAEEKKLESETDEINIRNIDSLVSQGYTRESAIKSLDLPERFLLLRKEGEPEQQDETDDNPDVDDGDEAQNSPGASSGGSKRKNPKVLNELSEADIQYYEAQLREPPRALMQAQVDRAIATLDPSDVETTPTDEDKEKFLDDMMTTIGSVLLYGGMVQWEQGRNLLREAGLNPPTDTYSVTESALERYRRYLRTVMDSYSHDTTQSIRTVLERAFDQNYTRGETEAALRGIMNTDEWRVIRLSTSEINRSGGIASVEAMIKIQDDSEATVEKSMMTTSGNPCEFCLARVDKWFPVKKVMVKKGETVEGVDGGTFVNNWDSNYGHDLHANGGCVPIYRVVTE